MLHFHYLKKLATLKVGDVLDGPVEETDEAKVKDLRQYTLNYATTQAVTYYRCFVTAVDSGNLEMVGWVVNDKVKNCMLCLKLFGPASWRHHCRCCGNLVCSDCSNSRGLLENFEHLGPQKVCQQCFRPVSPLFILFLVC
jgi:hypothetical protein